MAGPEFRKRPDGKYEAEDVLGASVAIAALSGGSRTIMLALEVDGDDDRRIVLLALSPAVAGPIGPPTLRGGG